MVAEVQERTGRGARLRGRAAAVGAAVAAAAAVWLVAVPVLGQELDTAFPGREPATVGITMVLVSSVLSSLAGWALLALLELVARARAMVVWTAVAAAVLVLSFSPVLQVEAAGSTKVTLGLLHLVVGAVLILGFRRTR
ncbi:DUF6069 family protein [Actinomadura sp. 21ATH]|uniref:DUF6069 family protein n=1 Tax=Actinomadura sp. 21ATH TaxID=1735444 RepID=UPI0035BEE3AD